MLSGIVIIFLFLLFLAALVTVAFLVNKNKKSRNDDLAVFESACFNIGEDNCDIPGISYKENYCPNPNGCYVDGKLSFGTVSLEKNVCSKSCIKSRWEITMEKVCSYPSGLTCIKKGEFPTEILKYKCEEADGKGSNACVVQGGKEFLAPFIANSLCKTSNNSVMCEPGAEIQVESKCSSPTNGIELCGDYIVETGAGTGKYRKCGQGSLNYISSCNHINDLSPYDSWRDLLRVGLTRVNTKCGVLNASLEYEEVPGRCRSDNDLIPTNYNGKVINDVCLETCLFYRQTTDAAINITDTDIIERFKTLGGNYYYILYETSTEKYLLTTKHTPCANISFTGDKSVGIFGDCLGISDPIKEPVELVFIKISEIMANRLIYNVDVGCDEEDIIENNGLLFLNNLSEYKTFIENGTEESLVIMNNLVYAENNLGALYRNDIDIYDPNFLNNTRIYWYPFDQTNVPLVGYKPIENSVVRLRNINDEFDIIPEIRASITRFVRVISKLASEAVNFDDWDINGKITFKKTSYTDKKELFDKRTSRISKCNVFRKI